MSAPHHAANPPNSATDSSFSKTSRSHSQSARSFLPQGSIRTVVTAPPWARDEPPSPKDELPPSTTRERFTDSRSDNRPAEQRPSDVASYQSSFVDENEAGPSRWWAFTRHRPGDSASQPLAVNAPRQGRDRSLSMAWLTSTITRSGEHDGAVKQKAADAADGAERAVSPRNMHLDLPAPGSPSPITLAQTRTPGWDIPWSPRAPGEDVGAWDREGDDAADSRDDDNEKSGNWQNRKKRIRVYMLTNAYVPLLFRFVNITLTTSALAISIRIRVIERENRITGALGSSPTLVIIFAPLTLVHVMIAIYVEYFGRPLGLWRTSGKLAHTLVEVIFICLWSAALALSFDNFFTSIIPCASVSSISWYHSSQLPRPPPIPGLNGSTGTGGTLCNEQLALICLVGVGLIMYCFNLVISLYRIFEKVKYHPTTRS